MFGDIFVAILLLVMGLALIILGTFAAYFGSGKLKAYGTGLGVLGLALWLITYFSKGMLQINFLQVIYNGILYLVSAIVGVIIALLIFLAVLLKT